MHKAWDWLNLGLKPMLLPLLKHRTPTTHRQICFDIPARGPALSKEFDLNGSPWLRRETCSARYLWGAGGDERVFGSLPGWQLSWRALQHRDLFKHLSVTRSVTPQPGAWASQESLERSLTCQQRPLQVQIELHNDKPTVKVVCKGKSNWAIWKPPSGRYKSTGMVSLQLIGRNQFPRHSGDHMDPQMFTALPMVETME